MRARRLTASDLETLTPADLLGAVVLAPLHLGDIQISKGTRLDLEQAEAVLRGRFEVPLAWAEAGDLHEDEAAARLAHAAAGGGVTLATPRQSRLDLVARTDGVLHVQVGPLGRLNALDPLEIFTLYHGQAVGAGQVVASVKVAPHLVAESVVTEGESIAREAAPLVDVRPYLDMEVGALVLEHITADGLARFEAGAQTKVAALGSRFAGTLVVPPTSSADAGRAVASALETLVRERRLPVVLVGGVSAGDPLSPFYAALETLGGKVRRRGVPAHPGSMIWLAELGDTMLLGLPQCGMFTLATAADLVLARLLTGERLTSASLAELAHGGVLVKEMRFRFPAYARDLPSPEG